MDQIPRGVLTGSDTLKLFQIAKEKGFAIPAVNVTSTSTANAVLEAARDINSPIILQISNGGAAFFAGKGVLNANQRVVIIGATSAALHIRNVAEAYGVPVVLHSDHCAKNLLPWFDGMLEEDEKYFKVHGVPLYSSHMLDLSEEKDPENIETCRQYLERMAKINCFLEMEIGITGGEEDGVNNEGAEASRLYTQPEQVYSVYETLIKISPQFSIAAAFGNVHGVYAPGNVKLSPHLLGEHQKFVHEKIGGDDKKPLLLVMHGGSGSTEEEIKTAVSNGIVKMNVDTDTQWSYWNGILGFYKQKEGYLQGQIGNPEGPKKPNKAYYDPRVWLRKAEESMRDRVRIACENLGNVNTLQQ